MLPPLDDIEDFTRNVALEAADGFKLGMSFMNSFGNICLCSGIGCKRPIAMICSALFAALSPPRFKRCLDTIPEDAGTGLAPHSAAKLASERRRPLLSPAVSNS